jgi:hypothetical protein
MRTAPLPTFRKLWGRIEEDVYKGNYSVTIQNSFDVSEWNGEKHFVVSTAYQLGGRSTALPWTLIAGGILAFVLAAVITALEMYKGYKEEEEKLIQLEDFEESS